MTNYGTIPTSSRPEPAVNLEFVSRAKERIKSGFATRRPWKQMFDFQALSIPRLSEAFSRIKTNLSFFRMNYAIIMLSILFASLLWHPISLIVFIAMMALWLFLYFLRDEPLAVLGRTIDDSTVLVVLSVLTVVLLLLTNATANIISSVLVGAVVVVVHAAVRKTEDLYLDEEVAAG